MTDEVVPERVAELVPERLRQRVQPLLPQRPPRRFRHPGRLPRNDRAALAGIVHVLITGCTWGQVPTEQFGCSGVTCLAATSRLDRGRRVAPTASGPAR